MEQAPDTLSLTLSAPCFDEIKTVATLLPEQRDYDIGTVALDARTPEFTLIPPHPVMQRPLLEGAMSVVRWADYNNLLPKSFIENDGFFTSMVIANLGSIGMAPAFHHLYEYGTCPLFMMVGRIEDRPVVVDGKVVAQKTLPIRWSYDERIDDGLTSKYGMASARDALENPIEAFGALPQSSAKSHISVA